MMQLKFTYLTGLICFLLYIQVAVIASGLRFCSKDLSNESRNVWEQDMGQLVCGTPVTVLIPQVFYPPLTMLPMFSKKEQKPENSTIPKFLKGASRERFVQYFLSSEPGVVIQAGSTTLDVRLLAFRFLLLAEQYNYTGITTSSSTSRNTSSTNTGVRYRIVRTNCADEDIDPSSILVSVNSSSRRMATISFEKASNLPNQNSSKNNNNSSSNINANIKKITHFLNNMTRCSGQAHSWLTINREQLNSIIFDYFLSGENNTKSEKVFDQNTPDLNISLGEIQFKSSVIARIFINVKFSTSQNNTHTGNETEIPLQSYGKNIVLDYQSRLNAIVFKNPILDAIFFWIIRIIITTFLVIMGCELDYKIIWQNVRRPVGILIGFASQFFLMPLIGLGVGLLCLHFAPAVANATGGWEDGDRFIIQIFAFALLLVGCSPGGSNSNMWAALLGGNLELSMCMTFFSSIAALGMMPIWLLITGPLLIPRREISPGNSTQTLDSSVEAQIRVPYLDLLIQLVTVIVPVIIGILIRVFLPRVAGFLRKLMKPMALFVILFFFTFGIYLNLPMFILMGLYWYIIPISALLPWFGFLFGYVFAWILLRKHREAITIAIETGIQNIGVTILILKFAFPAPEGDIGAIVGLTIGLITPLPLYIVGLFFCVKRRVCCKCCCPNEAEKAEKEEKRQQKLAKKMNRKNGGQDKELVTKGDLENGSAEAEGLEDSSRKDMIRIKSEYTNELSAPNGDTFPVREDNIELTNLPNGKVDMGDLNASITENGSENDASDFKKL